MASNFDEVDFVELRLEIELMLPELLQFGVDFFEVGKFIGECFGLCVYCDVWEGVDLGEELGDEEWVVELVEDVEGVGYLWKRGEVFDIGI